MQRSVAFIKWIVAVDHGGQDILSNITDFLESRGDIVHEIPSLDQKDDFPDIVSQAVSLFHEKDAHFMILVCGSGVGIMMAANACKGIRAAWAGGDHVTKLARHHNNANTLCFGARIHEISDIYRQLEVFATTPFEGGRHVRRLEKLEKLKGV